MKMKFAKLAILVSLTGASTIGVGQNNSSPSATDERGAAVYDTGHNDNRSARDETGPDCAKKKHKEKNKRDVKPAPSQQEQEFEKVLQGIHG